MCNLADAYQRYSSSYGTFRLAIIEYPINGPLSTQSRIYLFERWIDVHSAVLVRYHKNHIPSRQFVLARINKDNLVPPLLK
jgi:hypothetical protein